MQKLKVETGIELSLIDVTQIQPISEKIDSLLHQYEQIITIEEGYTSGLSAQITRFFKKIKNSKRYTQLGLKTNIGFKEMKEINYKKKQAFQMKKFYEK